MCAVIILFAFIMSLIINLIERMIIHNQRQNQDSRPADAFATENIGNTGTRDSIK